MTALTSGQDLITFPAVRSQLGFVSLTPATPQSEVSFSTQPHSSITMFFPRATAKSCAVVNKVSNGFQSLSPEQEPRLYPSTPTMSAPSGDQTAAPPFAPSYVTRWSVQTYLSFVTPASSKR